MNQTQSTPLPADLISLPGDVFVARAIERLGVKDMTPREHHALAQALYRGVNKSRVWESLAARGDGRSASPAPGLPSSLVRPDDEIAILEVLIDHAPEDDVIFIDYAFFRLVGRDPELSERLRLQNALAQGDLDRRGVVDSILASSRAEGREPVVAAMAGDQPFALISGEQSERIVLIKRLATKEYLVADGGLRNARVTSAGLELLGGAALAGPKRSLRPGRWILVLDWAQDDQAAIAVEVTANGGADKLLSVTCVGSARCSLELEVLPEHLVCEVLIHGVRKGVAEAWMVQPREVSLAWSGQ